MLWCHMPIGTIYHMWHHSLACDVIMFDVTRHAISNPEVMILYKFHVCDIVAWSLISLTLWNDVNSLSKSSYTTSLPMCLHHIRYLCLSFQFSLQIWAHSNEQMHSTWSTQLYIRVKGGQSCSTLWVVSNPDARQNDIWKVASGYHFIRQQLAKT